MKNDITGKVSIMLKAPIKKVWEALTDPKIIKKYFFDTNTITDWKVGSPIKFTGEYQGKKYEDKGEIKAFEKYKLIRYTYWSSMSGIEDKPENYVVITYELSGDDNNVELKLTQENIQDKKTKEHSEENWKKVLEDLKKEVENKQ